MDKDTADNDTNGSTALRPKGSSNSASQESTVTTELTNVTAVTKSLNDRVLYFLSTASKESLVACLVGLSATTYFVLGRVGLILIGIFGGVLLQISWEGTVYDNNNDEAQPRHQWRRKETGLDVVSRVLAWRLEKAVHNEEDRESSQFASSLQAAEKPSYSAFGARTAAALEEFTEAVIRDYVVWWYSPILPSEESFPAACRRTLTAFLYSVSTNLSKKRPVDDFLDFLTNSSSIAIVFLKEISAAFAASPNLPPEKAMAAYLRLMPLSNLANLLDKDHQQRKLGMVADDLLESFLEPKTYNCEPARVFLKQAFAQLVLDMTLQRCCKSEWINEWIVYLLEDAEPELMNAIHSGVEGSAPRALHAAELKATAHEQALNDVADAAEQENAAKHRRAVSKAQEAMDDAIQEAQRLTQLIAEEEAKKLRGRQHASNANLSDAISEDTTLGIATPASSQSGSNESNLPPSPRGISMELSRPDSNTDDGAQSHVARSTFTDFDQLVPRPGVVAGSGSSELPAKTLLNARVSIFDDSVPGEKSTMKSKPATEYLFQVEPSSTHYPGWMIARKYAELETLHEILRRISVISGVGFTESHATLPSWKTNTKASLRGELERYLNDALRSRALAESEGMKRFLEKDDGQGRAQTSSAKSGPAWSAPSALESMGKGMIDVFAKAPKEVAGGGKSLIGGVTGVLGNVSNIGSKKASSRPGSLKSPEKTATASNVRLEDYSNPNTQGRMSQESIRSVRARPAMEGQTTDSPHIERTFSHTSVGSGTFKRSSTGLISERSVTTVSEEAIDPLASLGIDSSLNLPPPPSEIPDDYGSNNPLPRTDNMKVDDAGIHRSQTPNVRTSSSLDDSIVHDKASKKLDRTVQKPDRKQKPPMTEEETQVAVELLFALISELYTLSSAWNIRRTLLNAAKTFLLRPGNPQLENIRLLLQESIIDANTSDEGIAAHVRKLRENTLPTEAELKTWPPPPNEQQKAALREKARRLLVERGMPQALTSVMGAAASGEALGKVFDCLQIEDVARGLMFGLLLQGMRVITQ